MNDRLRNMRIAAKLTQEQLAEKMNVSRQSIAKWENGESVPDVVKCHELAKILGMEIEDIAAAFVNDIEYNHPKNKYVFGISRIVNHQIVIPEEALRVFNLKDGDELLVLGDTTQGMALINKKAYDDFVTQLQKLPVIGGNADEDSN